jgi:hypothetical protein
LTEFAEVIKDGIEDRLFDVHTSLPGIITSYDPAKQRASVRCAIKRRYPDGTLTEMPVIQDVPVQFPKGGNFHFTWPVAAGDECILVFSERSLEVWKRDGGVVNPIDGRKFNISDAVALVGVSTSKKFIPGASATKARMVNGSTEVELDASGKTTIKSAAATMEMLANGEVKISNGGGFIKLSSDGKFNFTMGGEDILQILIDFATATAAINVLTVFGPQPILPPNQALISQVVAKLTAIKG